MTDRDALIAAIHADPDDDTARLVYADWLQENGQAERADFIRAEIEAARAEPFGPQARRAAQRASKLLDAHRSIWIRHLHGGFAEWPRFRARFRGTSLRGANRVRTACGRTLQRGAGAFAQTVSVRRNGRSHLVPVAPRIAVLASAPAAGTLLALFVEDEFAGLSTCPHLAGLRELSLRDNPVPPAWLAEVLRGSFPELMSLDLADNPHLGPRLAESLPAAHHRELRKLDLSGVVFTTSEQLQRVLKSRCLRQVQELRLARDGGNGQPGPLFYLDLSFVIPWERLVILDLSGQRLGNEGVRDSPRQQKPRRSAGSAWRRMVSGRTPSGTSSNRSTSRYQLSQRRGECIQPERQGSAATATSPRR